MLKADLTTRYMSDKLNLAIGLVYICVCWFLGCLLIYYGVKFYKVRDEMIVVKRRGNLVIAYNICSIVLLMAGYPLNILLYWCKGCLIPTDSFYFYVLAIAAELMFTPWFFFSGVLKVFRYFMIYYDIHLSRSWQNLKWTICINSDIASLKKQNFWVHHRRTIGNVPYMIKRIIFIMTIISGGAIATTLLYLFHVTDLQIWFFINSAVMIPTVASVVLIWKKCPYFNDNIFLYKVCS